MLRGKGKRPFEIGGARDLEHRAEDLLLVGLHVRSHAVDQRTAEIESVLIALHLEAAAVDHKLGAFLLAKCDVIEHLLAMRRRDQWAIGGILVGRKADLQCLHAPLQFADQRFR